MFGNTRAGKSAMGFNKRKIEDARKTEADKEAARRGLGPQILEDAERLIADWKPAPGQANADAVRADDRRRHRRAALGALGSVPGLLHHQCDRPAHARPASRCGNHQPYPSAVMPIMPAQCALRRAGAALAAQERGRAGRCWEVSVAYDGPK